MGQWDTRDIRDAWDSWDSWDSWDTWDSASPDFFQKVVERGHNVSATPLFAAFRLSHLRVEQAWDSVGHGTDGNGLNASSNNN